MRHSGALYTLTTPAGTLTFNPDASSGLFLDYDGMQFTADVRTSRVSRPQAHGSYMDNGFEEGATGVIKGVIGASTLAARKTLEDTFLKCARSLLGEEGTGTLTWTEPGGSSPTDDRRITGLRLAAPVQLQGRGGMLMGFQLMLAAEKSTAEESTSSNEDSSALTDGGTGLDFALTFPLVFEASTGGELTLTNSGTATAYPVLQVYGPIGAPRVTHTTSGSVLPFTSSIGTGDYWEIDLFERTIKLNGLTSVLQNLDMDDATWFGLTVGSNTLRLTGSGFDSNTKLRVVMRDAYAI